jgi:hypothetical protein
LLLEAVLGLTRLAALQHKQLIKEKQAVQAAVAVLRPLLRLVESEEVLRLVKGSEEATELTLPTMAAGLT